MPRKCYENFIREESISYLINYIGDSMLEPKKGPNDLEMTYTSKETKANPLDPHSSKNTSVSRIGRDN